MHSVMIITYEESDECIILIDNGYGREYRKPVEIPRADISDEKMRVVVALCNALEIDPEKLKEMI